MSPLMHSFVIGLILVNVCLAITGWSIWFERKFAGRMQSRQGPTEVGWTGLLQPVADILKLLQKEDTALENADTDSDGQLTAAEGIAALEAYLGFTLWNGF